MTFKKLIPYAAAAAFVSVSAHAMDFAKDEDAVNLRKAHMDLVGTYFGDMGAMIKGKKPFDAAQFQSNADRLAVVTQWSGEGFEGKHLTSDSKAKPEIWENKAEFDKLMKAFSEKAGKLKIASASGVMKDSIPAFKEVADSCGSCHKKFKNK
ncbi:c-type cytochrome [Sansalvadorimonas verongulae]|uniref:c-type cytochrome n=1 Tax=Sansalvadorimonas verongulae TaxID=2172824 RepID=UPI0018AD2116|nr:cytochrome c [Sansalvadorimonas verongulae]